MAKNRSERFKGAPVLEELAAIADGHQLRAVPLNTDSPMILRDAQAVPVFAPNGDIMPQLELLPWMVNLVDYIVDAVEPGATRGEFVEKHSLEAVSGWFWEMDGDELHSFVAFRLERTLIGADMWLQHPGNGSEPYVGRQRVTVGSLDGYAAYWRHDLDDDSVLCATANRLRRTLHHYKDWGDLQTKDPRCAEIFARFKRGGQLTHEDIQCLRDNGYL